MKDINQSQEDLNVYRIRELLKKIRIRTNRRIRSSYTINEERTKIIMKITRRKNVLKN